MASHECKMQKSLIFLEGSGDPAQGKTLSGTVIERRRV